MAGAVPVMSRTPVDRLPTVDALRSAAALLIVLHHLALYGPLARALAHGSPVVSAVLAAYGRFAVYVFLVVAGFMAARTFGDRAANADHLPAIRLIARRYLRLILPLGAALLLAMFVAGLARHWSAEDYLPSAPSLWQVLTHLGLLQSLLGLESLTTGVWYIAVEMQLFVAFVLLLKIDIGLPRSGLPAGRIGLLVLASWLWWHGRPGLDDWAPYFFGAYGLGILAAWTSGARLQGQRLLWMAVLTAAAVFLAADWRGRMAVALVTAVALCRWGPRQDLLAFCAGPVRWLGQRSYALFLVHFPVLMLVNTVLGQMPALAAVPALLWLGLTLALGVLAAAAFHATVERPCHALLGGYSRAAALRRHGLSSALSRFPWWGRAPIPHIAPQAVTNHD